MRTTCLDLLRRGAVVGPVALAILFVTGCVSNRHRELSRAFAAQQQSAYARHELRPREPAGEMIAPETFAEEVQQQLLAAKQRWEQQLQDADGEPALASQSLPEDVDARLHGEVELAQVLALLAPLNPGVAAARERLRATLEQYPQAASLDAILQQYNAFTKQLDTKIGPQQHKQMRAMRFPFPDSLALKGKLVSEEAEIAKLDVEIALRDARAALRKAYHDYVYVGEAVAITKESQQLLEQMIEVAQAKIRGGKAKYNAVVMAQVELSKLTDRIATLKEKRRTVAARINTLLGRAPDAPMGTPQTPETPAPAPAAALYPVAIENRQELRQQRLRIARMGTMVKLARRMAYPDPSRGASYFERRMQSNGTDKPSFMRERQVNPDQAADFGRKDAYIREVRLRIGGMRKALRKQEDQTRLAVKEAWFALDTARRSRELYRGSLLPQAEQSLEAASAAYRAGNADFLTFLDAQRTLLQFRLQRQQARRDYGKAYARLEQLMGGQRPGRE